MQAIDKLHKAALSLFFRYGIRHVTMDDVAREAGMSKKTIYQFYREKDDLVKQLCEIELNEHECQFDILQQQASDPIHEIILISEKMRQMMQHINPTFFIDLRRFYPAAFSRYEAFREGCAFRNLLVNIKKGIGSGYFRPGLDPEFIARYRLAQVDMLMFGDYFSFDKVSFAQTHELLLDLFVHSICTAKGTKAYNSYKKREDDKTVN